MSITYLWPSMLPVVDQNAYFWAGPVNDGLNILSQAGSPMVAPFIAAGEIRPMSLVYLHTTADNVCTVSTAHRPGSLVGVAISPNDRDGNVVVKMAGRARVRTSDTNPGNYVSGHVACATGGGRVTASSNPAHSNIAVGDIIGAGPGYYDVLLRVISNAGFSPRVFGRSATSTRTGIRAAAVFNEPQAQEGFMVAKARFRVETYGSPYVYRAIPAGSGSGGADTGFAMTAGDFVATQESNGIRLTMNRELVAGMSSAKVVFNTLPGGTLLNGLGCAASGSVVDVRASNWNAVMHNTGVVVQVMVTGKFQE